MVRIAHHLEELNPLLYRTRSSCQRVGLWTKMAEDSEAFSDGVESCKMKESPEEKASFISRIFFVYMFPLVFRFKNSPITTNDLFRLLPSMASANVTENIKSKLRSTNLRLRWKVSLQFLRDMLWNLLPPLLEEVLKLANFYFVSVIISHFNHRASFEEALNSAVYFAGSMILVCALHHRNFYNLQLIGLRMRTGLSGLIMKQLLVLSTAIPITIGLIQNLLITETARLDNVPTYAPFVILGVIIVALYSAFLYSLVQASVFPGVLFLVILMMVSVYINNRTSQKKDLVKPWMFARSEATKEAVTSITAIKAQVLEEKTLLEVDALREKELMAYETYADSLALVSSISMVGHNSAICAILITAFVCDIPFNLSMIFTMVGLLYMLRFPLMEFIPTAIRTGKEAFNALKLIENFLEADKMNADTHYDIYDNPYELNVVSLGHRQKILPINGLSQEGKRNSEIFISLKNCSTVWDPQTIAIQNANLHAVNGQLIVVSGKVGSGKSSLLLSLLNETNLLCGSRKTAGQIAYCSQNANLFGDTVKDIICFGEEFQEDRVIRALDASDLFEEVRKLPNGINSFVGENGCALSGGQRQRLALARAIYFDADIYLLDDPFSALDAAVGRRIFEKCVKKMLKDRLVVLVSHNSMIMRSADTVVIMEKGKIARIGRPNDTVGSVLLKSEELYTGAESNTTVDGQARCKENDSDASSTSNGSRASSLDEDECRSSASWRIFGIYLRAMFERPWLFAVTVFLLVSSQTMRNVGDMLLVPLVKANEMSHRQLQQGNISFTREYHEIFYGFDFYVKDYIVLISFLVIVMSLFSYLGLLCLRKLHVWASHILHKRMIRGVINTSTTFFDENARGNILGRFARDLELMDDQVPYATIEFTLTFLKLMGTLATIALTNVWLILCAVPCGFVAILRSYYVATSKDAKRLECSTRNPIIAHVIAVREGLPVIRAFRKQEFILRQFHELMDKQISATILSYNTTRWFNATTEWLVNLTTILCIVGLLYFHNYIVLSAAQFALFVTYIVRLSKLVPYFFKQSAELVNAMVPVGRIIEYAELASEHNVHDVPTSQSWEPANGDIKFEGVSMKYSPCNDYALNSLSFAIGDSEKIGIVGRTGSGKSSLFRSLFRLNSPCEGRIFIGGEDTSCVALKDLRRYIGCITQEPFIFSGTIRENLDPHGTLTSDKMVWEALEEVQLSCLVSLLPEKLETKMETTHPIFSKGEHQLLCLARAIIEKARIVFIDEATANIDSESDSIVQRAIRKHFASSTVLMIAHKLETVIDCDRIMVLDCGRIVEFGHAWDLLKIPNGVFANLVKETGPGAKELAKKAAMSFGI